MNANLTAQIGRLSGPAPNPGELVAPPSGSLEIGRPACQPRTSDELKRELAAQNEAKRQAAADLETSRQAAAMMAELLKIQTIQTL
ncbi:hypothetical protein [Phenylobacterium aquaticum]|uniref:hypothetical protein n=1 Tax=Phenylobacterium aquaticum TaxID=1763816 RepID=UPI0026EBD1BE|nr:hypothetical protein [Phenylobacterium aquaticum]